MTRLACFLLLLAGGQRAFGAALVSKEFPSNGCDERPSFTPDGQTLVYDGFLDGGRGLFKLDLKTGERTRLTQQKAEVWDYWEEWDHAPQVSPDGRTIAYLHEVRDGTEVRTMPITGDGAGDPQTITRTLQPHAWRDNQSLLVFDEKGRILRVDTKTHAGEEILAPKVDGTPLNAMELPGHRLLLLVRGRTPDFFVSSFSMVNLDTQALTPISMGQLPVLWSRFGGLALSLDKQWFYHVTGAVGPKAQLAASALGGGTPEVVADVRYPTGGFAFSHDHRRLAYSTCRLFQTFGRLDGEGAITELLPRAEDIGYYVPHQVDANTLVFGTFSEAGIQVWSVDLKSKEKTVLVKNGILGSTTADKKMLFSRPGHGLYAQRLGQTEEHPLTEGAFDTSPVQSFDRKYVYYVAANKLGGAGPIRRVPVAGGASELVAEGQFDYVRASPTEDRLLYFSDPDSTLMERVGRAKAVPFFAGMPNVGYDSVEFSADGHKLLLVREARELQEVTVKGDRHPRLLKKMGNVAVTTATYDSHGAPMFNMLVWGGGLTVADGQFR